MTALASSRRMGVTVNDATRTEIEAAAFRGLVAHLQNRTDVQNIDLMVLSGFCRNCLAKWYMAGAAERGAQVLACPAQCKTARRAPPLTLIPAHRT